MAQNINYIPNFQDNWSNTTQYAVIQMVSVAGLLYYACPLVNYNGDMYIANDISNQPTYGTAPNADSAWSLFNAISTSKFSTVSASAPTVNDDNTNGYIVGSQWFNTTTSFLYVATSVATGAATWVKVLV